MPLDRQSAATFAEAAAQSITNMRKIEMARFQPGISGNPNGRPKGSKNKLQEAFWTDFAAAWTEHGAAAMQKIAKDDPATFVKVAASIMPKDLSMEVNHPFAVIPEVMESAEEWEAMYRPNGHE
jgi:hypothetical protein